MWERLQQWPKSLNDSNDNTHPRTSKGQHLADVELIEFEEGFHVGLRHRRRPYRLQNISLPRPPQIRVLFCLTGSPHCETHSDKLDNEQENCPLETAIRGASAPKLREAWAHLHPPQWLKGKKTRFSLSKLPLQR